jgi:uncharacterized protein YdaU (DUF1376 family)
MSKKKPAEAPQRRPFFKAWPSNFLGGCMVLSAEEKGVYYTLLMLLYDKWEPIDDSTVKKRQELARICGLSTRGFGTIVERLLAMPGKLKRDATGMLTNERFERARGGQIEDRSDLDDKKKASKSIINGGLNDAGLNENSDLTPSRTHTRANLPESRVHIPEQSHGAAAGGEEKQGQGKADPVALESELSQICTLLGVDMRADTKRITWPQQLMRLKTEFELDVQLDIIPAIKSYSGQLKGTAIRSLMYVKERALEHKQARLLADRIESVSTSRQQVSVAELTRDQWIDHLRQFLALGSWPSTSAGPSPLQPGCAAPGDILEQARAKWEAQGNHPEAMHHGGARVPWAPGKAGAVREVTPFATPA